MGNVSPFCAISLVLYPLCTGSHGECHHSWCVAMQNALISYLFVFFLFDFDFLWGGGGGGGGGEKFSIQSKKILYLLSIYYVLQTLKCPLE